MRIVIRIEAEVERAKGVFAPKDEIRDALLDAVMVADPGTLYGLGANGDTDYEITNWEVEVVE